MLVKNYFKKLYLLMGFLAIILIPSLLFSHPAVTLLDKNGNPVKAQLDKADKVVAANGSVYYRGPAYSPKQTCGKCHNYNDVNKAYHFRTGAGPNGDSKHIDDLWVSKNKDTNPLQKYLTHAYGHLESAGQYGAW